MQAASGEGTVVYIEVGVTIFEFGLLRVTGNPDGEGTGGVQDFLRDVGAEPAKHLSTPALVLQNIGSFGKCVIHFPKALKRF